MNTELFKALPCQIKYELYESRFTQGNDLIKNTREFQDKSFHFTNIRKSQTNCKALSSFIDLLMYVTNDVMISKDEYKKYFETNLEKSTEYLKSISHKSRMLKTQIIDVIEDRSLVCDSPNCMKFFSNLLKMNISIMINSKFISEYFVDNFSKTLYISNINNQYDFDFNIIENNVTTTYKPYISIKLMKELSVSDLRVIYATLLKNNSKSKKKTELIDELTKYLEEY
tara:strand:- start:6862 stop:7542 length:681 start_codon:yes stop_codon:yes gene_type:complete